MIIISLLILAISSNSYQILNSINCGSSTTVKTKLITYQKDRFFHPESVRIVKQPLKSSVNSDDSLLIDQYRTSMINKISRKPIPVNYLIPLQKQGHYILYLKFFEREFKQKGKRVFHLKIGDQIIFTIDIYAEVGFQKVLNKWVQFDLEDEVIYLNKTYPALNAYYIDSKSISVSMDSIKERATIQSLFFVYGQNQLDTQSFKDKFMANQQAKSKISKEYISQKYRNPPKNKFKVLQGNQHFQIEKQDFSFYIRKIFSFRTLVSLIGVSIILFNQTAIEKIKNAFSKKKQEKKKQQ